MNSPPLRIGLTGGIASGKTTVADMFAELGITVVDTDIVAREVVRPGEPALDEIRREFGDAVIDARGELDRGAMREIVFSDDAKRTKLESILHPRIRERTISQVAAAKGPYVIIVVPLLVESPMKEFMDRVLIVDCSEETQLERLTARDRDSDAQARRIIAAQASREERLGIADDVIVNDDEIEQTRKQVAALHDSYLSLTDDKAENSFA